MSEIGNASRSAAGAVARPPAAGGWAAGPIRVNPRVREFLKYGIASGIALGVDFATLTFCTEILGVHYLSSAAIGFALGVATIYALSVRWVFGARSLRNRAAERTLFVVIGLAGLGLNHVIMYGLTELAGLPYQLSKLASAVCVFTFNFGLRKLILFRAPAGLDRS